MTRGVDGMRELRRNVAFWIFGGGFIGSLISFLYPVIRFLNPPAVSEASVNEVVDGKVQDLRPNSGKIVKFGTQPVLLIRLTQSDWRAFSADLYPSGLHRPVRWGAQADLVRLSQRSIRSERKSHLQDRHRPH